MFVYPRAWGPRVTCMSLYTSYTYVYIYIHIYVFNDCVKLLMEHRQHKSCGYKSHVALPTEVPLSTFQGKPGDSIYCDARVAIIYLDIPWYVPWFNDLSIFTMYLPTLPFPPTLLYPYPSISMLYHVIYIYRPSLGWMLVEGPWMQGAYGYD